MLRLHHLNILILTIRSPLRTLSRTSLLKHLINLFKTQAFGLVDTEVSEEEGKTASTSPNEEDFDAQVALVCVYDVRGDEGDDEVPEPI